MAKRQSIKTLLPAIQRNADPVVLAEALGILQDQADSLAKSAATSSTSSSSSGTVTPDVLIASPTGLAATAATTLTDGILSVTVTGTLPTDANMAGIRFIIERPAPGDVDAEHLTLPGVLGNYIPSWYTSGNGATFSQSFEISKPSGRERILIYALPFAEGYENPLVRLTQQSPALPANVTAYAALNIGDSLTVGGSELTDVSATGTPTVTPTGFGTLRVSGQYVPPYLTGPVVAIGDFQGVTVWYEDETGKVENLQDQPYLGTYDATPPDNLGDWTATIPVPPSGSTVYFTLCAYSTTKHLPYRNRANAPSSIVVSISITGTTISSGLATQVSAFAVAVQTASPSGVASGAKQGNFHITYTPPVDVKWKEVWIDRIFTDASHVPLTGEIWSEPVPSSTGVLDLGPWPWPTTTQNFTYRARSVNFDGVPNNTSAPQVFITVSGDGTFVIANHAIAEAMLQDLAVSARALADAAVTSTKYAPLSITSAAIGIAAINDANIANLSLGKLTPAVGAVTIEASGDIAIKSGSNTAYLTGTSFSANALNAATIASVGSHLSVGSSGSYLDVTSAGTQVANLFVTAWGDAAGTLNQLLPSQTGNSGKVLGTNGSAASWVSSSGSLPSQTGNSGKFLKTDGSTPSWAAPAEVPSVIGHSGQYLYSDGAGYSWQTPREVPTTSGSSTKFLRALGAGTPSWQEVSWDDIANRPTPRFTGTFLDQTGKTVTVEDGIIKSVV